ncbi:hypothetical protein ACPDHL_12890 [Myroides sp. C15-4]|uniref:hypothetical protein n=1 Tax=Myroides sp. C15-4 TaxID=3400532 RepID=UPI003D2F7527
MAEIKREILDGADRAIRTIGMTVYETPYKNKKSAQIERSSGLSAACLKSYSRIIEKKLLYCFARGLHC